MMKYVFAGLICAVLFASCNSNEPSATDLPDHALYHVPTVQPFTDSILNNPSEARYYFMRAEALSNLNEDSMALIDVRRAAALDSLNQQYAFTIGYLLLGQNKATEAIEALNRSEKLSPGNLNTALLLSEAHLTNNDIAAAQLQLDQILSRHPGHPAANYWQAKIKAQQKDLPGAVAILERVVRQHPGHYEANFQLADWYRDMGKKEAIDQYRRTYALDTNDVAPLYEIGAMYEQQQQWKLAKEAYRYCIEKDLDYTDAYLRIGTILLHQDSTEKALRQFNIAVATSPASAEAYFNKGRCFEKLHLADSAIVAYGQALVFDKNMEAARTALQKLKK
jgi:tetratricopeptide (TPR) repeat protein